MTAFGADLAVAAYERGCAGQANRGAASRTTREKVGATVVRTGDRVFDRALRACPSRESMRGQASVTSQRRTPYFSQHATLDRTMSARDGFEAIASTCLKQLCENEMCARDPADIEGLHQFRVGVRRLRALAGAFKRRIGPELGAYLSAELDWLQSRSGGARDWDVLIKKCLRPLRDCMPADATIPTMLGVAETLREEAYLEVRRAFDAPRYTALLARLHDTLSDRSRSDWRYSDGEAIDTPITQVALELLKRRHKNLKRSKAAISQSGEAGMHELRVSVKKMRYVAEFFRDLYPGRTNKKFISALINVQECLGAVNDAAVGQRLAEMLGCRVAQEADQVLSARAKGVLLGWQAACVDRGVYEFRSAWHTLRGCQPHWKG